MKLGDKNSGRGTDKVEKVLTKNGAFRDAKRRVGIPNSTQHKKPVDVFDGTTENRRIDEFKVDGITSILDIHQKIILVINEQAVGEEGD